MGERKVEVRKLENETERMATFYKLREELFQDAAEISELEGVQIAIAGFTPTGEPFAFGHPSTNNVFDRFLQGGSSNQLESNNVNNLSTQNTDLSNHQMKKFKELEELVEHETRRNDKRETKFWWDTIDINQYNSLDELLAVQAELEKVKQKVLKQLEEKS